MDLFHEEYYADGDLVIFECDECGYTSLSLGGVHGHIESHRGYTRFGIQIPFTKTSVANVGELMKLTNVYKVTEKEEIDINEVEEL
mgnify:CR=1 FL=1